MQEAQLLPSVPVELGKFGTSVAISGDYAVVGEPGYDCPERPGRATVYRRVGQSWIEMTTLMCSPSAGDNIGQSVSIDGSQIIAGGFGYGSSPPWGKACVYELEAAEHNWILKKMLVSPTVNPKSRFGNATAISGPWAVVGDPHGFDAAHFFAVGEDCNANGKADICDIRAGVSQDANSDDRPDECPQCGGYDLPTLSAGPVPEPFPACSSGSYAPKNRYLTFIPPKTPYGAAGLALRVTLGPMPGPADCPGVGDFSAADGAQMWVGPEYMAGAMPTGVHRLQPTPYFYNWNLLPDGVLKLTDCNIVPCAAYTIDAISDVDYPAGPYSPAITLTTAPVWGDIVAQGSGTLPNGIVDFSDVSAMVDRFRGSLSAPPGTWCDVASINPVQGAHFNIDFGDISVVVDAFRGKDYPFGAPSAPAACP